MVGYSIHGKSYRILLPEGKIIERADVVFDESGETRPIIREQNPGLFFGDSDGDDDFKWLYGSDQERSDEDGTSGGHAGGSQEESSRTETTEGSTSQGTKYSKCLTRSGKEFATKKHAGGGRVHFKEREDIQERSVYMAKGAEDFQDVPRYQGEDVKIPETYQQAMASKEKKEWRDAMEKEYRSLIKNGVFTRVPRTKGMKIVKTRWVNTVKTDQDNDVTGFKSRTVAKGFTQKKGVDYIDTFSPTSVPTTVRAIVAHAAAEGRSLIQCDVVTAYLNAPIKEEIYIEPSEGFEDDPQVVWKLNKCLYGLKQSAREWNETLTEALKTIGFKEGNADPCLFVRTSDGRAWRISLGTRAKAAAARERACRQREKHVLAR